MEKKVEDRTRVMPRGLHLTQWSLRPSSMASGLITYQEYLHRKLNPCGLSPLAPICTFQLIPLLAFLIIFLWDLIDLLHETSYASPLAFVNI